MQTTVEVTTRYYEVLRTVWADDPSLINTYHAIAPCTLSAAIQHSVRTLKKHVAPDFVFVLVRLGGTIVGFFGVEPGDNYLVTFALHRQYRTAELKQELWEHIRTFTNGEVVLRCILHQHNIRARRFLEENGGVLSGALLHKKQKGVIFEL